MDTRDLLYIDHIQGKTLLLCELWDPKKKYYGLSLYFTMQEAQLQHSARLTTQVLPRMVPNTEILKNKEVLICLVSLLAVLEYARGYVTSGNKINNQNLKKF